MSMYRFRGVADLYPMVVMWLLVWLFSVNLYGSCQGCVAKSQRIMGVGEPQRFCREYQSLTILEVHHT